MIARIAEVATRTGTYIAAGLNVVTTEAPYTRNEVVMIDPQGRTAWTYEKSYPVPGLDQLTPGDRRVRTIDTPFGRIAAVICFDANFPGLMRQAREVDLMLVPSNDWPEYGQTHTERTVLRAVENGYTLIRQDSHGMARMIAPTGRTLVTSDFFRTGQQTMVADVPKRGTPTLYTAIGDVFAWICLAGLLLLVLQSFRAVATTAARSSATS